MSAAEPVFRSVGGGTFTPTGHARGPWDSQAQHGGAPAALLAGVIEATETGARMFVGRLTYEFLGPVPLAPLEASAQVTRPGRRFQLVEGELRAGGRPVLRARAVRLRRGDVRLPQEAMAPSAPPCDGPDASAQSPFPGSGEEEGFHRTAMDIRFAGGTTYGPGPALAWFRLRRPLVEGQAPSPLQRVVAAADFANGVSRVLDFDQHLFVNTDLTVHLHREVEGEWVLLDARTVASPLGVGVASAQLHDESGAIGGASQTLFVDER